MKNVKEKQPRASECISVGRPWKDAKPLNESNNRTNQVNNLFLYYNDFIYSNINIIIWV